MKKILFIIFLFIGRVNAQNCSEYDSLIKEAGELSDYALFYGEGYIFQKYIDIQKYCPNKQQEIEQKIIKFIQREKCNYGISWKNGHYYFINQKGKFVPKLGKWKHATAFEFNYLKYSKVIDNKGVEYYLDTLGHTFQVALTPEMINKETIIIDFERKVFSNDTKTPIKFLPKSIRNAPKIEEIYLFRNELKTLPPEIKYLKNLRYLGIYGNPIEYLPSEIKYLKKLEEFHLGGEELKEIPLEIAELQSLKKLYLYSTSASIPHTIRNLKNLSYLEWTGNDYKTLPIEFCNIKSLKSIIIQYSLITSLPSQIQHLKQLKYLKIIGEGRFRSVHISAEIGELKSLENLVLISNDLETISYTIGNLKNLHRLVLQSNELTKLPLTIGELENLEELDVYDNKLTELPSEISNLKKLKLLNLKANPISEAEKEQIRKWLPHCKIIFE